VGRPNLASYAKWTTEPLCYLGTDQVDYYSIAQAFTSVTTSLVSDILLPPFSIIFPLNRNMEEKFAVLQPGPNYNATNGYTTLDLAQDDGAVVLAYGYD
jgi:large-conductance mechanosensitive channel